MVKEKIKLNRVMTAVVGSYPKPKYLFPGSGRELLDTCGRALYEVEKKIGKKEFKEGSGCTTVDARILAKARQYVC